MKITQLAWYMPCSREFSMQFYHQRFPSSALINCSVFNLENLHRINGSGPLGTSATVWVCKSNKNHANGMVMQIYREFSMQFYHQRFPSSELLNRSVYNPENLDRINGCGPLATSATVWVYKSNKNHAAGMVCAQQQGIFNAILPSTLSVIRID